MSQSLQSLPFEVLGTAALCHAVWHNSSKKILPEAHAASTETCLKLLARFIGRLRWCRFGGWSEPSLISSHFPRYWHGFLWSFVGTSGWSQFSSFLVFRDSLFFIFNHYLRGCLEMLDQWDLPSHPRWIDWIHMKIYPMDLIDQFTQLDSSNGSTAEVLLSLRLLTLGLVWCPGLGEGQQMRRSKWWRHRGGTRFFRYYHYYFFFCCCCW